MIKRKTLTLFASVLVICLLASCSSNEIPDSKDIPVQNFSMINQDKKTVNLDSLKGEVWVADFIFTSCEDVCLPMTSNMSKLQKALEKEGLEEVRLISYSIDPEVDTPEVLKRIGEQFNADFTNWDFLTGYEQKYIEEFAKDSFQMMVHKPENEDQVIHGVSFFLVNQEGNVVQMYNGTDEFPLEDIIKHIKILRK